MPTDPVALLSGDKGTVRNADTSYPPAGTVTTNTGALLIERSFDSGTAQYVIRDLFTRFRPPVHPGATSYSYTFTVVISGKDDDDTRDLLIQEYPTYAGGIDTSLYDEVAPSTGILATVPIASLSIGPNIITISGIGSGPFDSQRWSISGVIPAGKNALSISSIVQNAHYSLSATPGMLNIDGDSSSGKIIDEDSTHRFGWATGQAGTAYELFYRIVGAGSWSSTGIITTPNQYHDFASSFFTAPNDYEWYVVEYDDESNASANSEQKTFSVVGTLADPTITAPASIVSSALPSFASSGPTHTKEQFKFLESSVVIYDSGELNQTSGAHTPPSGQGNGWKGSNAHLQDGHAYVAEITYIDSSGARGTATAAFTVLFTPPDVPVLVVTAQGSFLNLNYESTDSDTVDLLYAAAYDPIRNPSGYDPELNPSAAFSNIITDLPPSDEADEDTGPNYGWYEVKHGQLYFLKARAWLGMAFIDSEIVDATPDIPSWITIHRIDSPAESVQTFEGTVTLGGNESNLTRGWKPQRASVFVLNRADPIISEEVTSLGVVVAERTWSVALLMVGDTMQRRQMIADAETLLTSGSELCIRERDTPIGLMGIGKVMSLNPPSHDSLMNKYVLSFSFTLSRP